MHGGWIHTLLTCLLLLAAGPLLEAVWGRRLFGAACALSVLFGALVFRLVHADLDRALVGGGALVSALVAARWSRFWDQEVDLAGWLEPLTSLELRVPVWSLAAGLGRLSGGAALGGAAGISPEVSRTRRESPRAWRPPRLGPGSPSGWRDPAWKPASARASRPSRRGPPAATSTSRR